ncbi:MAG: hypothetical protein HC819_05665 [Cyclobacteriaceae bacterium]|nr:hypothetical protein [Cyclobacteriaceae bacterium]
MNQVLFSEIKKIIDGLVDQFPEKRKEIFLLSRTQGLPNHELAPKCNISTNTV